MEEQKKPQFGVTKETKAVNSAPLLTATKLVTPDPQYPAGYKFPIAYLVNVVYNPELAKKDETTTPVLQFVFKDKEQRQYTHTEWVVESNDSAYDKKMEGMNSRIKHIYTAVFSKFPDNGVGTEATSFANFFELVAKAFNSITTGEEDKKKRAYLAVSLYYKLTYYKTRLGFPLSPNFLERVVPQQACKLLAINPTYDKLEPTGAAKGGIPGIGGGGAPEGDLPNFEEEYK